MKMKKKNNNKHCTFRIIISDTLYLLKKNDVKKFINGYKIGRIRSLNRYVSSFIHLPYVKQKLFCRYTKKKSHIDNEIFMRS